MPQGLVTSVHMTLSCPKGQLQGDCKRVNGDDAETDMDTIVISVRESDKEEEEEEITDGKLWTCSKDSHQLCSIGLGPEKCLWRR
jgi:hypothetical protein